MKNGRTSVMNDQFLFAEEPAPSNDALSERWKILIVDDRARSSCCDSTGVE